MALTSKALTARSLWKGCLMVERLISSFDGDPLSVPTYTGPVATRCYYPNYAASAKQMQSYSWHQVKD